MIIRILITLFLFQSIAQANCLGLYGVRKLPKHVSTDSVGKSHFQYGFESEFTMKDAEKLLSKYMPDPKKVSMGKKKWLKLTHEEKINYIHKKQDDLFPDYRNEGFFVKIDDDPYDYLPHSFLLDSGNFEIRIGPFDSYTEWKTAMKSVNESLGVGSMQTSISVPQESFFAGVNPVSENMGYFKSINEFDTIEKLKKGFERSRTKPDILAAKSFDHPWLGPSNAAKDAKLKTLLEKNLNGDYSNMNLIGTNIDSHKFIGGTVYRPDVATAQKRILNEIRDCHRDPKCLDLKVKRFEKIHSEGKEKFEVANKFISFNRAESFRQFTNKIQSEKGAQVQDMLKELFPNYWKSGTSQHAVLDKYLNFSYPLRDWSGHIDVMKDVSKSMGVDLSSKISSAQTNYVRKLDQVAEKLYGTKITAEAAKKEVQKALVEFVDESKVHSVMEKWMSGKI